MTANSSNSPSLLNVPNTLSGIRLIGAGVLVLLALYGDPFVFGVVFAVLVVTDWFDGKLAIMLDQRTDFGARLDSIADSSLYTALLFGFCWLKWDVIADCWPWIVVGAASYAVSVAFSYLKFGQLPSYHTYAAKGTWHLLNFAVLFVFLGWSSWPLQLTAAAVTLVNLEAMAITWRLKQCRVDVRSFWLLGREPTS